MGQSMSEPVFRFPAVLRCLAYPSQIRDGDTKVVERTIQEATALLARFSLEMNLSVLYDQRIREPWNLNQPHCLVEQNLATARLIHAQGYSNSSFADVLGKPLPGLEAIPLDADLLSTDVYDGAAAECLAYLDRIPGICAANATKLLHQKRPGMFPVLDELVRRALDLPWTDGEAAAFRSILQMYRGAVQTREKINFVEALRDRLSSSCAAHLADKPTIRILDALAWSMMIYSDPFEPLC